MPSLLPGYEYDIFISYRHNDNRSGWVTEFVEALQEELASTIKESLSIYFDKNPHDGLLETHHVDKSLEGKLKCLIFIPILSQTYCDPKSFAWQHEFCAFNKLAQEDEIGRDIKLSNGNVASRILPIKIHDLDGEDQSTIEKEIESVLRPIEFIYKEPGVNRPLVSTDDKNDNQNRIDYRNQINKTANAIKDLITSIKSGSVSENTKPATKQDSQEATNQKRGFRKISNVLIAALLVFAIAAVWYYNKGNRAAKKEIDKSLVVLPFEDLSEGQDQEWFSDGLTEELLNRLSEVHELKLISRTTSFSFKGKNLSAKKIADSLGVSYILEGSVRKVNDQLRITAQLIKASDDTHLWSSTYDHKVDSIFAIQDHISESITNALNIFMDAKEREKMFAVGTRNVKAYEEYLKGMALFHEAHLNDFNLLLNANEHFEKAIAYDPKFAAPHYSHQDVFTHYFLHGLFKEQLAKYSDQEIAAFISNDLDAAIRYAATDDQRIRYQMDKYTLSNDWTAIPALTEKIINRRLSPPGWGQSILLFSNASYVLEHELGQLGRDQFDETARIWAAATLSSMNLMDSASNILGNEFVTSTNGIFIKSWIENKRYNFNESLRLLEKRGYQSTSAYAFAKLLAGKFKKKKFDRYLDSLVSAKPVGTLGPVMIHFYHALGEYEKANTIANQIDSKFMGPLILADYLIFNGLIYNLSATPNFAQRLRELGIDPVAFEKEHYYTYPPVVFKE